VWHLLFPAEKPEDPFHPEPEPVGFFPPAQRKRPTFPFVTDDSHRLPPVDGFIPNSVLIRLLFPEKPAVEEQISESQTAELTASQMEDSNLQVAYNNFIYIITVFMWFVFTDLKLSSPYRFRILTGRRRSVEWSKPRG